MTQSNEIVETPVVESLILVLRGKRVILDADLARLYGVTTKVLNQAVRRNTTRFPEDFLFQVTVAEKVELVTNCDRFKNLKHSTSLPTAFTEYGAIMAATLLNSARAVAVSVLIVRAFVRMRDALAAKPEIESKLGELESRVDGHDSSIHGIVQALKALMQPDVGKKKQIGFGREGEN